MRLIIKLNKYSLLGFIIILVGCSYANTGALKDRSEIKLSSTPSSVIQDSDSKYIKETGWQVPLPEKKKIVKTSKATIDSESGKHVEIVITAYAPIDDFLFRIEPDNPYQKKGLFDEVLKLESIEEIKVKERIFWYTIFARKAKFGEQKSNNISHEHAFVYRILDKDGDGKFETLLTDSSKILVPQWAVAQ